MQEPVIIIGAGQAGATVALHLREKGFDGPITLIGAEPHPPYQRPPLSKKYLSGEWGVERLYLRDPASFASLGIVLMTGVPVEAIDPVARCLQLGGQSLRWHQLVLATGATSRPLPPGLAGMANVFELRTIADVERLKPAFRPDARLVVIGGGFIGLETAAVAARAGMRVSVVERAARLLERAVGPATSAAVQALHAREGVRIILNRQIEAVAGEVEVESLTLDDGTVLAADAVLVGIGVVPQTTLAAACGLHLDNGIATDSFGRTSASRVWAAGDCASFPYGDHRLRLESVQNAIDQAKVVAEDMLGIARPYRPVPWFWSDQYDSKLQIAGLRDGATQAVERKGRAGHSCWYFADGHLLAVEAINDAGAFMTGRRLLEAGGSPDPAQLADPAFDLRSCLA